MKIIFALLFFAFSTLPIELRAQTPESDRIQKGNKTVISVPVSVSDREGRYISGLKKEDFSLYQDGVKQKISFFATEDEPLSIALMIDTSGSTKDVLGKIKDAAKDFVELLNPHDQCLIATFDSQVNILNSFTSNQEQLKNSVKKIQTAEKEGTVVFRAVEQIAKSSFANVQGRKVIILLSDGKDLGSSVTKNELLNDLEESDILIYTLFYKTGMSSNKLKIDSDGTIKEVKEKKKPEKKKPEKKKPEKKKKVYSISIPLPGDMYTEEEIKLSEKVSDIEAVNFLKQISDTTAGRFYLYDSPNLSSIFKNIAGELRQQYRLGYYSKEVVNAAESHDITVKVDREGTVVRTRGKFRDKQL